MYSIQSLFGSHSKQQPQQQVLSLNPGQLLTGKVLKHYPDQLASVHIRGMTVMAKLETPVAAGSSYWFLVEQGKNLPTLKIVQPEANQSLLKADVFADAKWAARPEANQLLQHMRAAGVPFSTTQLEEGVQLIRQLPSFDRSGFPIIARMIQEQLPLSPIVYHAVHSLNQPESLSNSLSGLLKANVGNGEGEAIQTLQTLLQKAQGPVVRSPLNEVLRILTDPSSSNETKQASVQLLARLGWPQVSFSTDPNQLINSLQTLNRAHPTDLTQLLTQPQQRSLAEQWPAVIKQNLTPLEKDIVQKVLIQTVSQSVNVEASTIPFAKQLQQLIQLTGYQHEADMLAGKQEPPTIKAALLQLLQDSASPEVRTLAESALHKITGHQLQSVQTDSMVNLLLQFPLKLGDVQSDLTLQFQGKKQNDGSIDPGHCKLLFLLSLEHLKETMIEVTIQKRVAKVTITNHQEKPTYLLSLLEPHLRERLEDGNYQLSSLSWQQWTKDTESKQLKIESFQNDAQRMDIRI